MFGVVVPLNNRWRCRSLCKSAKNIRDFLFRKNYDTFIQGNQTNKQTKFINNKMLQITKKLNKLILSLKFKSHSCFLNIIKFAYIQNVKPRHKNLWHCNSRDRKHENNSTKRRVSNSKKTRATDCGMLLKTVAMKNDLFRTE